MSSYPSVLSTHSPLNPLYSIPPPYSILSFPSTLCTEYSVFHHPSVLSVPSPHCTQFNFSPAFRLMKGTHFIFLMDFSMRTPLHRVCLLFIMSVSCWWPCLPVSIRNRIRMVLGYPPNHLLGALFWVCHFSIGLLEKFQIFQPKSQPNLFNSGFRY